MEENGIKICDCCNFATDKLHKVDAPINSEDRTPFELCDICYNTHISSSCMYSRQYESVDAQILQSIAYCTNVVLKRLDEIEKQLNKGGKSEK